MNDLSKPFRVTIEHYDEKVIIEKDHSDIDANELREMLISAVRAVGFGEESLDVIFGSEEL